MESAIFTLGPAQNNIINDCFREFACIGEAKDGDKADLPISSEKLSSEKLQKLAELNAAIYLVNKGIEFKYKPAQQD